MDCRAPTSSRLEGQSLWGNFLLGIETGSSSPNYSQEFLAISAATKGTGELAAYNTDTTAKSPRGKMMIDGQMVRLADGN